MKQWKLEREKIEMEKKKQDVENLLMKRKQEKQKQLLEIRQRVIIQMILCFKI